MLLEKGLEPKCDLDRIGPSLGRLFRGLPDQDPRPLSLADQGRLKGVVEHPKVKVLVLAVNLVQVNGNNGSPGRTRTCSLAVTSAPSFRTGLDYLITPKGVGRFALLRLPEEDYGLSA